MTVQPVGHISEAVNDATLPEPLYWVDIDGQRLYQLYGMSGGLSWAVGATIMQIPPESADGIDLGHPNNEVEGKCGGRWFNIRFGVEDSCEVATQKINAGVKALVGK